MRKPSTQSGADTVTRFTYAGFTLAILGFAGTGAAVDAAESDLQLRSTLEKLRDQDLWGEAVLDQGRVRQIRVNSITGDTVSVREVVGPFQEKGATYVLEEFQTVRELGEFRIARGRSMYKPEKSLVTGMLIELVVPGGGYYYAGENKQALVLVLISAAATATAIQTGQDGAAGWVPIMAWTKVASLLHLADEIGASNASHGHGGSTLVEARADGRSRSEAKSTRAVAPLLQLRHSFY